MQPLKNREPELASPFVPDLHDGRYLRLKAALLLLWVLVSFGSTYFARELQSFVAAGWPLGYWMAAQGAVVMFIAIVVAYCWAMDRFERQDAESPAGPAVEQTPSHG